MIIKHREGPGKIAEMHFVGNVENCDVIIVDDLIDTAVNFLYHQSIKIREHFARLPRC
jgi:Phosphoribosylpyrophosphate synthetase